MTNQAPYVEIVWYAGVVWLSEKDGEDGQGQEPQRNRVGLLGLCRPFSIQNSCLGGSPNAPPCSTLTPPVHRVEDLVLGDREWNREWNLSNLHLSFWSYSGQKPFHVAVSNRDTTLRRAIILMRQMKKDRTAAQGQMTGNVEIHHQNYVI